MILRVWMPVPSKTITPQQDAVAFLGALSLFLATLEYLIPKPLPFFRLGLANLPLLLGLRFLSPGDLVRLLVLKVLGQALVNGTLASYVFFFSLAGSIASMGAMYLAHRYGKDCISLMGISLSGAMASSVVQLFLAVNFIFGKTAMVIAPFSLGSGFITGLTMGIFAMRFTSQSRWLLAFETRYRKAVE